jgi:hypothetical protein
VQSYHFAAYGHFTLYEFVNQLERRFYQVDFTDKTKTQLEWCHHGKKIVANYEIELYWTMRIRKQRSFDRA